MLKSLNQGVLVALFAVCLAGPLSAQNALEIDNDVVWTHPHSGIEVPTRLAGLPRSGALEFAPDHLNISFSFSAEGEEISLYIFRDTNGGVPVWFEQARIGIENRDVFGKPQLAYAIEPYAWPGHDAWQGQRGVYATPKSSITKSTGLALFSVKGWFVKVRASSNSRSAEELGQWIDTALAEITPPSTEQPQPPVIAVKDCEERLAFKKKAKDAKVDGGSAILSAVLGGVIADKMKERHEGETPQEAVEWCRDSALSTTQVAYRANGSTESYLIALGDSGVGISVGKDTSSQLLSDKKKANYAITVITETQRINFVPQNRLPSLKRVLEIINADRRTSAVSTWGKDSAIEINSDAMK